MIPLSISFFCQSVCLVTYTNIHEPPEGFPGKSVARSQFVGRPKAFGGQVYNYLIAWAPIVIPSLLRNLKIYTRLATSGLLPKCTEDVIDAKASQRVLGIPL